MLFRSGWERGANNPLMDKLEIMSDIFNVPVSYFFTNMEQPIHERFVKIPILGEIACGEPITAQENIEGYYERPADGLPSGSVIYLRAKGASMEPKIPDGSLVLIREHDRQTTFAYVGEVGSNFDPKITTVNPVKEGSLVMFRDSFGNALLPFMADAYSSAYFSRGVPYQMSEVDEKNADTVIVERADRKSVV